MEIKQTKDVCVDKLTVVRGEELEIAANLVDRLQIAAVLEGYVCRALNARFGVEKEEMLLRLTCSWQGRCRDDLTSIGKVPDIQGWTMGGDKQQ